MWITFLAAIIEMFMAVRLTVGKYRTMITMDSGSDEVMSRRNPFSENESWRSADCNVVVSQPIRVGMYGCEPGEIACDCAPDAAHVSSNMTINASTGFFNGRIIPNANAFAHDTWAFYSWKSLGSIEVT